VKRDLKTIKKLDSFHIFGNESSFFHLGLRRMAKNRQIFSGLNEKAVFCSCVINAL